MATQAERILNALKESRPLTEGKVPFKIKDGFDRSLKSLSEISRTTCITKRAIEEWAQKNPAKADKANQAVQSLTQADATLKQGRRHIDKAFDALK